MGITWRVLAFLETPEASVEQTDTECDRLSVLVGLMLLQSFRSFCMHSTALSTWSGSIQFVNVEAIVISFDEETNRTTESFPAGRIQIESRQIIQSAKPITV